MTKYFIETKDEDFIIDIPEGAQVLMGENGYGNETTTLRVVNREAVEYKSVDYSNVQYNDHVLAVYHDVKACRSEEVKRLDPEVA